jgi:hypothetical protein
MGGLDPQERVVVIVEAVGRPHHSPMDGEHRSPAPSHPPDAPVGKPEPPLFLA